MIGQTFTWLRTFLSAAVDKAIEAVATQAVRR
jgi:hypothetical protein